MTQNEPNSDKESVVIQ